MTGRRVSSLLPAATQCRWIELITISQGDQVASTVSTGGEHR